MKKIVILLIAMFFSVNLVINSQTIIKNNDIPIPTNIPHEKIFIHHNTSFLLTGEYLYYKVYCLNVETGTLSNISKIAYVELVGIDKSSFFKHKIRLESGLGQGDFFIPASLPSGNYKLIAYTQWMRNGGKNRFFQDDISIVNPFQENQKAILEVNELTDTLQVISDKADVDNAIFSSDFVNLKLDTNSFTNREKVSLTVNSLKDERSFGNFSISVRKIDPIKIPTRLTTNTYMSLYAKKLEPLKNNGTFYLPELRGEILSGKVLFRDTESPASKIRVALSIPGKEYLSKMASTNDSGIFFFNLDKEYINDNATIQVVNNKRENFKISMNHHESIDYGNLVFNDFKITPKMKDFILQQSINNQIENAYFSVKPHSIDTTQPLIPFYKARAKEYLLDDYTRFPSIKETVVEVIENVSIRQKKGTSVFHVKGYVPRNESEPLVLIDGNIIQNHDDVIAYNARKVKKIGFVRDNYLYGSQLFEGIVYLETFEGAYKNNISNDHIKNIKLFKPSITKKYFNQIYDADNRLDRIPDYRSQLLWEPNLNLNKKTQILSFFTSDNDGDYEICIEGFTKEGKPISLKEIIHVK